MARMTASTVSPCLSTSLGWWIFLAPGHFGDVDEAFDAGLDFDEGAEVGEASDGAGDALADLIFALRGLPGFGLKLLEAERNLFGVGIDFEDADLDLLADGEHVFGLVDAAPGDVADVEKAIDAAEVDECAVGREAAHGAVEHVAGLHGGVAAFLQGAGLFFEDDAAVDDDVFVGDVELGDAAGDFSADDFLEFGGFAGAAAAGGHEGADADVDGEAALDDAGDGADDGDFLGEGFFERGPVAGLGDFEQREIVVALFVAALDGDVDFVADLDAVGVVREGGARENAFGLVTDVEENLVGGEGDDGALDLLDAGGGLVGMGLLELGEDVGEVLLRLGRVLRRAAPRVPAERIESRELIPRADVRFGGSRGLAGGVARFGGGLGLGNAFVAHDGYSSIVPCETPCLLCAGMLFGSRMIVRENCVSVVRRRERTVFENKSSKSAPLRGVAS